MVWWISRRAFCYDPLYILNTGFIFDMTWNVPNVVLLWINLQRTQKLSTLVFAVIIKLNQSETS